MTAFKILETIETIKYTPPPGVCLMLSLDPIFGFALSLKSSLTVSIFLSPPPGLCVLLSSEPTLGTYYYFFVSTTRNICVVFGLDSRTGFPFEFSIFDFYLSASSDPTFDRTTLRFGDDITLSGDFGVIARVGVFNSDRSFFGILLGDLPTSFSFSLLHLVINNSTIQYLCAVVPNVHLSSDIGKHLYSGFCRRPHNVHNEVKI
ncbi:hypothetical protein AGLY_007813 [Aphis glycines]|uniref:Uncharacterized protein n=1 Tax=Aphis glycines TaxID=307491 RepID=A0A6G0TN36_APHGL|nr:hypothetical protein AGLY_007813 [Aphis glycines]